MSIRKQPEPAKGGKRLSWKANLLFAAVVLAAAALLFWLLRPRSKAEPLEAAKFLYHLNKCFNGKGIMLHGNGKALLCLCLLYVSLLHQTVLLNNLSGVA